MIRAGLSAVILAGICIPSFALELYVAPNGHDDNPGTKDQPFATINHARDTVRQIKKTVKEPVTVYIRGGTYYLDEPLVFTSEDSGNKQAPVDYKAVDGETVVLGGLIKEDLKTSEDKIPLLGDIPLLGRMFRSETKVSTKQNLVIFVTAKLITPTGELIKETKQYAY